MYVDCSVMKKHATSAQRSEGLGTHKGQLNSGVPIAAQGSGPTKLVSISSIYLQSCFDAAA